MFHAAKVWLVDLTGVSRDALHIYVAIALFLCVRIMWRGPWGSVAAVIMVLAAALTGEWLDHQMELLQGGVCDPAEHWHDLRNTMAAPLVLALALPWLRPRRSKAVPVEPSGEVTERRKEVGIVPQEEAVSSRPIGARA
jgi:hypothetical protein